MPTCNTGDGRITNASCRKVFLLRSFLPTAIGGGCACLFALLSIDVGRQALNRSFFLKCRDAICTCYSAPEVTPTDGDDLPRRPSRMRHPSVASNRVMQLRMRKRVGSYQLGMCEQQIAILVVAVLLRGLRILLFFLP
ncbi:hypothetical protein KCU92_g192, partial [Aureobasidium melanogenum]